MSAFAAPGSGAGLPYDVCLSFAGEQRDYVHEVATHLQHRNILVFYDLFETANLWGEDLVDYLDRIFRKNARFCIVFVSADYQRKMWTTHERRSIQARVVQSAGAYLLPVRFDDTELPGLLDTVGYVSARDHGPRQVAELLVAKLRASEHVLDGHPQPATPDAERPFRPMRVITSHLFGFSNVVGRENLLVDLQRSFQEEAVTDADQPVMRVVTGTGGIGKSTVARAFGIYSRSEYNVIWWIRAEDATLAAEDFRALLAAFGVPDVQRLLHPVQMAHTMLANRSDRWLLILDNVPQELDLRGLVPPEGRGDVVVTSRSSSWTQPQITIGVPPLDVHAGSLLLREVSRDDDEPAAIELVGELGGLPLALHQAASYVAENPIGLADYLRLYRAHRLRLHHLGSAPDYDLRIGTTWEVSIQMLPETAQTVLNILAWYDSDMVPLDLLTRGLSVDDAPASLAERIAAAFAHEIDCLTAVSSLSRYGLITVVGRNANMHRLVQAVTLDSLGDETGTPTDWATAAAAVLLAAMPAPPADADGIAAWLRLSPHVQHFLRLTPVPDSVESLRLRNWSAQWTGKVGRPNEAFDLCTHLVADQVRALGERHPDTLRTMHSQAQWAGESGDYEKAILLFDRVIALSAEVSGDDHPEALRAIHGSAYWVGEVGRPDDACDRLRRVLAKRENTLGAEHPDTLRTMHSLAYRTGQAGDYLAAQLMLQELLPIRNRILGPDHPHTLRTRYSLAQSVGNGGDSAQARDMTAALLVDQTRVLGADHPHTLRTRYNLAHWTGEAGNRDGQRLELIRLLDDQVRLLEPGNPDIERTRTALDATR